MKWRIYKEAAEEVNFKKLLKQNGVTKLPSGTEFKPDRVSWSKDGGYAGQKTLDRICSQLEDAGWKRGEWRTGGIPDGSAVTNSNAYTSPDGQLVMTYSEHFGATAHDNFYGFTFKLAEGPVNESDDDFDDYDEEIDYCVQYAKDAIDRILNQPGIDDFILSRRGKIPVPLKALLPYAAGTPDEELVEAICQRCSDDKIKVTGYGSGWTLIFPDIANQMNESGGPLKVGDQVRINHPEMDGRIGTIKKIGQPGGWMAKDDMCYVVTGYDPSGHPLGTWLHRKLLDKVERSRYMEASRFGFNIGDKVEFKVDMEPNRFGGWGKVKAGTQGEIVNIDKPMKGVIKVKLEDGTVVSVAERKIKFAGTDDEPWNKYKVPAKPKPTLDEILAKHGPEEIYMEPPRPGYPKWTGD